MGIKGFMKYLKHLKVEAKDVLVCPKQTVLLIDGSGWMFTLYDETLSRGNGGGYSLFRDIIIREIAFLRDILGFSIIVFFDGPESQLKAATKESRRLQRESKWHNIFDLINGQSEAQKSSIHNTNNSSPSQTFDQSTLPLPPLVSEQMKQTLRSLSVLCVNCAGEADQELALSCLAINNSDSSSYNCGSAVVDIVRRGQVTSAFVYGDDSDFILMKSIPYIRFPKLSSTEALSRVSNHCKNSVRQEISIEVWYRENVASALSLTEKQMVEYVIAVGNDFTSPFSRSLFACSVMQDMESQDYSVETLEFLRQYFISQGTSFFLYSLNSDLNSAIEYSREFYNLSDLKKYPYDSHVINYQSHMECLFGLSSDIQIRLDEYLKSTKKEKGAFLKSKLKTKISNMIGKIALGFLYELHQNPLVHDAKASSDRKVSLTASADVMYYQFDLLGSIVPDNLLGLVEMLKEVEEKHHNSIALGDANRCTTGGEEQFDIGSPSLAKNLNAFLCAHFYQLVSKKIIRHYRDVFSEFTIRKETEANVSLIFSPFAFFDAELYYSKLDIQRTAKYHCQESIERFLRNDGLVLITKGTTKKLNNDIVSMKKENYNGNNPIATKKKGMALLSMLKSGSSSKNASSGEKTKISEISVSDTELTSSFKSTSVDQKISTNAKLRPIIKEELLPIDAYRDEIISRIDQDPVTIIFGETGSGKSSRLPIMLLEHAEANNLPCRMMVSQPRRIAVSSLFRRVKDSVGVKVGMRMGHGVREEDPDTRIFYVTTGYLVRLLAHKPDAFKNHTHIIIDEVHERSVDGDVVCLLVRRLLSRFSHIKVILMSATIHTDLYKTYFSVGSNESDVRDPGFQADIFKEAEDTKLEHCLFVGTRRFPLEIMYLETMNEIIQGRPDVCMVANRLMKSCGGGQTKPGVCDLKSVYKATLNSVQFIKDQYTLAVHLISQVAPLGTSLLVFVSGMSDILELTEKLTHSSPKYSVVSIHSEIPFEEQEAAFLSPTQDEVKIILATNAAESSITLPDVDVIICLGMHKSICYDSERHHSVLRSNWISKASATQRAGRTGRVRPGRVFRLYTHQLFRDVMSEYGDPEILRVPLQETILNLRVMLEESADFQGVVPLLEDMLEPPDMRNVEQSFSYLHSIGMIDSPCDNGALTSTGTFVGSLPVGITLGRLIAYSVLLGVEQEGVIIAASLSLPKTPFRIASPLIHKDPAEYNAIVQRIYLAASSFDSGMYSEPLMLMNLLHSWRSLSDAEKKDRWAAKHGIVKARIRFFDSMAKNLQNNVSKLLIKSSFAVDALTNSEISFAEIKNMLRLVLLWTNGDRNLLKLSRVRNLPTNCRQLTLSSEKNLSPQQLETLFPLDVAPFEVVTTNESMFVFQIASSSFLSQKRSPNRIRDILLNMVKIAVINVYALVPLVWLKVEEEDERISSDKNDSTSPLSSAERITRVSYMIAVADVVQDVMFDRIINLTKEAISSKIENVSIPRAQEGDNSTTQQNSSFRIFRAEMFVTSKTSTPTKLDKLLCSNFSTFHTVLSFSHKIKVVYKNSEIPLSMLQELFFRDEPGDVEAKQTQIAPSCQCLEFLPEPSGNDNDDIEWLDNLQAETQEERNLCSGLIPDVALGIRLFKAYQSGLNNGKGNVLVRSIAESAMKTSHSSPVVGSSDWIQSKESPKDTSHTDAFPSSPIHVSSCPSMQWKNVLSSWKDSKQAFMDRYTVSNSMIYTGSLDLFAVAGNTLDLGGAVRCEGVTVLPPGGSWLTLALSCVNINPLPYFTPAGVEQISAEGLLTDDTLSQVEYIKDTLLKHRDGHLRRDNNLIVAVKEIFRSWTQSACLEDQPMFGIVKVEDLYYYKCPQCQLRFSDISSCITHVKKANHLRKLKMKKNANHSKSEQGRESNNTVKCRLSPLVPSTVTTVDDKTSSSFEKTPVVSTASATLSNGEDKNSTENGNSKNKSRKYVCTLIPLCSTSYKKRSFATAEGLQKHIEAKHGIDIKMIDDSLNTVTQSVSSISLTDQQTEKATRNSLCADENTTFVRLNCNICSRTFKSEESLRDHIAAKHGIKPNEFSCESPKNDGNELFMVVEKKKNSSKVVCPLCYGSGRTFKSEESLRDHMMARHGGKSIDIDESNPCKLTKRNSDVESDLQRTAEKRGNSSKFVCPHCHGGRNFNNEESLRDHMVAKHGINSDGIDHSGPCNNSDSKTFCQTDPFGLFKCHRPGCTMNENFLSLSLLNAHMKKYHDVDVDVEALMDSFFDSDDEYLP